MADRAVFQKEEHMRYSAIGVLVWICVMLVGMSEVGLSAEDNLPYGGYQTPTADMPDMYKSGFFDSGTPMYDTSIFWSGMDDAVIHDTLAYCAMENGLMILNVADPTDIKLVSTCYLPEGEAMDIKVREPYAYLAEWTNAFYIIDISDPVHPEIAGRYETPRAAYCVEVQGDSAYVGYSLEGDMVGLLILDISDPAEITLVHDISNPLNDYDSPKAIRVRDSIVYIVSEMFLWVLDVATSPPTSLCYYQNGYLFLDLEIHDSLLYLAEMEPMTPTYYGSFSILDISDPANPIELSRIHLNGPVIDVSVSGTTACISDGGDGIQFYDVSDPTAPDSLTLYEIRGLYCNLLAKDSLLYIFDWGEGWVDSEDTIPNDPDCGDMQILNISDPTMPEFVGYYNISEYVTRVVLSEDNYAYILNKRGDALDVKVVHIVSDDSLEIKDHYITSGSAQNALLISDTLYLAAGPAGLELINVANPDSIYLIRKYDMYSSAYSALHIEVGGDYAYVCAGKGAIQIFDLRLDGGPPVDILPIGDYALEARLYGDYLYLADRDAGVQIYNIADPENRYHVKTCEIASGTHNGMKISEGLLLAGSPYGFGVYDIETDPENPILFGSYNNAMGFSPDYSIYKNNVLRPGMREGFHFVDFSDPATMNDNVIIHNTPGIPQHAVANDDYIVLADKYSLIILENSIATDIETPMQTDMIPETYALHQNYPNPFNPKTRIKYDMTRRGHVRLTVYNILGQEVISLVDEIKSAGSHRVDWNGTDADGNPVAGGVYFYRITSDDQAETRKMLLLK